jgi:biopolymer transport protein ExbB
MKLIHPRLTKTILVAALALTSGASAAPAWWNTTWTLRKPVTVDTTAAGVPSAEPVAAAPVLLRLFDGNFQFAAATADGRDICVLAADGKTVLPAQVEKYDSLLNEAFVWVRVPELKPGAANAFSLYYGNAAAPLPEASAVDADSLLVYHFSNAGAPADSSGKGNNAAAPGVTSAGSLIGSGLRLIGGQPLTIPATPSLKRGAGQPLTWSAWVKFSAPADKAVLFHWGDATRYLQIGYAAGAPYVEVADGAAPVRSSAAAALAAGAWKHLAVGSSAGVTTLFVDGVEYSRVPAGLPALDAAALVGADSAGKNPFNGELDELAISGVVRSPAWIKFAAVSQAGTPDSLKLVALGNDEGEGAPAGGEEGFIGHTLEHVSLFGDIAKNMMFDGWISVGICITMMVIGWVVALRKFAYLKKVEQGTEEFLARWKEVSTDLTALDHADADNVKSLAGNADAARQRVMQQSPLFHIYHTGSEEIRHRLLDKRGFHGLSARSITAIKASLDASLTREVHRLNSGLVSLTIGIAGGPYVGLMGTVVGVMVTFAVIAKTGQVEVNSIAPGIASALLATVFGLLVAIPALFLYSFLNSRIKDAVSNMQLFIDEFITKMAEFYPVTDHTATNAPFMARRRREADDELQETTKK